MKFEITLKAMPGEIPAIVRLRAMLKTALRSYGLKCTGIRETATSELQTAATAQNTEGMSEND